MVHQEAAHYHKKPVSRLRYPTDLSLTNEARAFCEQFAEPNDRN